MIDLRPRSRRGGASPSATRCAVVLVIRSDTRASDEAIAATRRLAGGGTVGVVLVLPIHGYAFGLPNPGLLPNARERAAAERAMRETLAALERRHVDVDGEIVVTRNARRAVLRIVERRAARAVLIDAPAVSRLRRLVEGDLTTQLARRLGPATSVTRVGQPNDGGGS